MAEADKDWARKVAHWVVYEVIPMLHRYKVDIRDSLLAPQHLTDIIDMFDEKKISRETARYLIKGYIMRDPEFISEVPCCECGGKVVEFSVPSELWNMVMRPDGHETDKEYLCFDCWNKKLLIFIKNNMR